MLHAVFEIDVVGMLAIRTITQSPATTPSPSPMDVQLSEDRNAAEVHRLVHETTRRRFMETAW